MSEKNTNVSESKNTKLVAKDYTDGLVLKIKEKEGFGLSFPTGYNYTNELMSAMLILQETQDNNKKPVLESCTKTSIQNTLLDMVTMGLSMQKKQCYPVAYGGKLQCQVSVYGNTCMARNFGMKSINSMVIYDGDVFMYHIENAVKVIDKHEQNFENIDNDKIKGAYAVVTMNDGTSYVEIMNIGMIKQAWRQGFGYKENGNGTHQKFTDQMCMKTVKNRALKYIIRTYGTQELNDSYDRAEEVEQSNHIVESVQYDIDENANSEDFEIPTEAAEKVCGEVVDVDAEPEFAK